MIRIYRDIRFSRDKSPYKTEVAAHFCHESGKEESPAFYLRFEPGNSMAGGGLLRPEPKAAKKIRDAIVKDSAKWKKATNANGFPASFGIGGESLRRPPRGYDGSHPFIEDNVSRKSGLYTSLSRSIAPATKSLHMIIKKVARPLPSEILDRALGPENASLLILWEREIAGRVYSSRRYRAILPEYGDEFPGIADVSR
jgi:uncharacterized protein (TIGR02453 family)